MTEYVLEDGNGDVLTDANDEPMVYNSKEEAKEALPWVTTQSDPLPVTVEPRDEAAENSAEDNDDSNDTMSDYTFITTDDEEADNQQTEDDFSTIGNKWTLGEHSTVSNKQNSLAETIGATMDELDDDVDEDLKGVLKDAQDLVNSTNVSRFECPVGECGLGHSHSDHKHDIRSAFNVEADFADEMKFCPYCHCGANELAMLVQFYPYISEPVFTDQHEFEGVLEIDADDLQSVIQAVVSGEKTAKKAALQVVESRDSAIRSDLQMFLQRVNSIQNAANAAPIAQETRGVIEENREKLDGLTSQ